MWFSPSIRHVSRSKIHIYSYSEVESVGGFVGNFHVKIRRKAVERSICCFTSLDTANAMADCLALGKTIDDMHFVDITKL